jgi:hypothetical protein
MFVTKIVIMLAALAISSASSSSSNNNEAKAIAALRKLAHRQAQFRQAVLMDEDQDGIGEYGSFGELAGVVDLVRHGVGTPAPLSPPLLRAPFDAIGVNGFVTKSGYLFVVFLPDANFTPAGLHDVAGGGPNNAVDPDHGESLWCAYAWPVSAGTTGDRAFFVNQTGVVLATTMDTVVYTGVSYAPVYDAAFELTNMDSPLAISPLVAVDGNEWTVESGN